MKYLVFVGFLMMFGACQLPIDPPVDWVNWHEHNTPPTDTIPNDTIPTDSIVLDTCADFHTVTSPKFCGWYCTLDFPPTQYQFYYNSHNEFHEIDIDSFLTQYGDNSITFHSGINNGGILTGYDITNQFNTSLFLKDGFGGMLALSFAAYTMVFDGALTFDQFFSQLQSHPSVRRINFINTGYTCDEQTQVLNFLLEDCKAAPPGGIIDLRPISTSCIIDQALIDELIARGWTIWQ